MCIKILIYIYIFMWTLVTRVSLLFPLSLSFMRSTRTTTDDLNFLYRNFIVFSVVVYFIGEYALSLCEYSSKPSMDASASGGTLKTVGDFFSHQQARVRGDGGVHGSRHGGVDLDDGLFEHGDVVEAAQDWVAEYTEA